MFKISDLSVSGTNENSEAVPILRGINMEVLPGETHAIMGPNGSGKSTLAKIITGYPDYDVSSGDILFEGESLLEMDPDERALKGIFMAFQYPVEIPGVNNTSFMNHNLFCPVYNSSSPLGFSHLCSIYFSCTFVFPNTSM